MIKKLILPIIILSVLLSVAIPTICSATITEVESELEWTKNQDIYAHDFEEVVYGNGLFVAVTQLGVICSSKDGAEWSVRYTGDSEWLRDLIWAKDMFIAVGEKGTLLTSKDGFKWEKRSGVGSRTLVSAVYGNGKYIVSDFDGNLYLSHNGETWVRANIKSVGYYYALAWNGSQFLAVGPKSVAVSKDALIWKVYQHKTELLKSGSTMIRKIIWANNKYLAIADNEYVFSSQDGIEWTQKHKLQNSLGDVLWDGKQYVILNVYGVYTSIDTEIWNYTDTSKMFSLYNLTSVTYDGSKYIIVGAGGIVGESSDTVNWKKNSPVLNAVLNDVAWNGSRFVAVGSRETVITSEDGVNWEKIERNGFRWLNAVVWGNDKFVAVGDGGNVLVSKDGANWMEALIFTDVNFKDVIWNGSQFVAVGLKGAIFSSDDGIIWTQQISGTDALLSSVAWNRSMYIAAGSGGTLVTSKDGIDWQISEMKVKSTVIDYQITDILWDGKQFVATCGGFDSKTGYSSGIILKSPDGSSWTICEVSKQNNFYKVAYNNKKYVFLANGLENNIYESTDLVTFTYKKQTRLKPLNGVTFYDKGFVAVGMSNLILNGRYDYVSPAAKIKGSKDVRILTNNKLVITAEAFDNKKDKPIKVYLFRKGSDKELGSAACKSGETVTFNVTLTKGKNEFYVKAIDAAGNVYDQSLENSYFIAYYDCENPKINISEWDKELTKLDIKPKEDGIQIKSYVIEVYGEVADDVSLANGVAVTINGKAVTTDTSASANSAKFTYSLKLNKGRNEIIIKATDKSGRQTTVKKVVWVF